VVRKTVTPVQVSVSTWDKASEEEMKNRGRAVAFRTNEMHYAEVKTEGSVSNTAVTIIHDDKFASEFIGTGEATSNVVVIKQNSRSVEKMKFFSTGISYCKSQCLAQNLGFESGNNIRMDSSGGEVAVVGTTNVSPGGGKNWVINPYGTKMGQIQPTGGVQFNTATAV
jgi:hypothetical protein